MSIYDGDIIEKNGHKYRVNIEADQDMGAPWEEHDGHGIVSGWTTRDKGAGEWVLCADRGSKRFYDFAGTMKLARKDGWGLNDEAKAGLAARTGKTVAELTEGEITAESVRRDYEYLKGWCNNDWHWCGVIVTDITDDEYAPNDYSNALWGIGNSDRGIYLEEIAHELIGEHECHHAEQEKQTRIENRFQDALNCGI